MAEEVEMTPITETEAGVPPKVAPFGAASAAPVPAPAAPAPAPAAPVPAPAAPAPAPAAPVPAPAASATSKPPTIRLKPVIRRPMIRKPGALPAARPAAAPAATVSTNATAVAKKQTSNLKSVTGSIPAQAVLKKTGIVAEGILTPAQQQAAKSKTSRISLESAMGVAPAKETPAPLKTIRLRRPVDLKPAAAPAAPAPVPAPASAADAVDDASTEAATLIKKPVPAPVAEAEEPAADAGTTQKKTLKLHRPSVSLKRPSMGLSKAPAATTSVTTVAKAPEAGADVPEIADIPDVKPIPGFEPAAAGDGTVAGAPAWMTTLAAVAALAAVLVMGAVTWYLWQEGTGPDAGANAMAFLNM